MCGLWTRMEICLNIYVWSFAPWPTISWKQVFVLALRFLAHELSILWKFHGLSSKSKHGRASKTWWMNLWSTSKYIHFCLINICLLLFWLQKCSLFLTTDYIWTFSNFVLFINQPFNSVVKILGKIFPTAGSKDTPSLIIRLTIFFIYIFVYWVYSGHFLFLG